MLAILQNVESNKYNSSKDERTYKKMIPAIGAVGHDYDPEYLRIIKELRMLGIVPSGNKQIDKSKLKAAKQKLEEKFELKNETYIQEDNYTAREESESKRQGATLVGEINKILLGIY